MRTFLAVAVFSLAGVAVPAFAQSNPDDPVQRYQLLNGGAIHHLQYDGALLRFDGAGRQTARAKVPKSGALEASTRVVMSKSEEKLLLVYSGRTSNWSPKHKVLFLDARSLKTVADLPLGDCEFVAFAPFADTQRLVCQQSRNPADPKKKPTLAFVALDVNHGTVLTWFDLGGERRGSWFGPMFFGYFDDAFRIPVAAGRCVVQGHHPTPGSPDDTNYYQPDPLLIETLDLNERPTSIIVLGRFRGPSKGDVWFVGPEPTATPQRAASLNRRPSFAAVCGNRLQLVLSGE